ncbi:MAG: hypothetical protein LQ340_007303 [Diploschistes diacapsis]|nr:MAG: hypothetical protein LQ340_007303 [Diploschistes diacapsis]
MSITYQEQEMSSLDDKRKSEFVRVSHYAAGPMDREAAALARSGKKQVLKVRSPRREHLDAGANANISRTAGGPAGIIYGMIFTWAGTLSVFVTLGELASMMPTSSGQYHWVNLLAPKSTKKFLSYVTGGFEIISPAAAVTDMRCKDG